MRWKRRTLAQARIFENLIQNLLARAARENFRNLPALAQNFNNFSKFACTLEIRGEKIGKICLRRCQKFACKKFACASKKILAWAKTDGRRTEDGWTGGDGRRREETGGGQTDGRRTDGQTDGQSGRTDKMSPSTTEITYYHNHIRQVTQDGLCE